MRRAFALLGLLACATAFAQAQIPIEHFTRSDEFSGIGISPDGKFVALLSGVQGRSQLAFIDLENKKVVSGVQMQRYSLIDTYRWLGPNRLIYTTLNSSPSDPAPIENTAIYAINRDGTHHHRIYGEWWQSTAHATAELLGSPGSNDPNYVLFAEYPLRSLGSYYYENTAARPMISRVNVYTGDRSRLGAAPFAGARILLDHNNEVRFALGYTEQLSPSAALRRDPDRAWQTFELEGLRRDGARPIRLAPDDRSVFLIAVRDRETFAALYRLDLQTHAVEKVYGFDNADVEDVITDFADRRIVGVRGPTEYWLLPQDPAAQTYQALHRAFPGQRVQVTSASGDGRWTIVLTSSDINPGDYYLFDTTTKRAEFLRAARAWIQTKNMRAKEQITLIARDGLQLHGYVTRPTGDWAHPLVVLPHNGPWGERDTWGFDWEAQLLASRGYAVLQVNYRGSAGYGVDFERAGDGQWGGKIQDDITDATRWAIEHGIAVPGRICIAGRGYGGFAALSGVIREPSLYRCAISYGGLYDLSSETARTDLQRADRERMDRVLGTDATKLRALSPIANAKSIGVPVLLIHGRKDWKVRYRQADLMKRALDREGRQVELMTLSREGPTVYDEDTRREVYERILAFLDANLKTSQPAASLQPARPGTP